MRHIGAYYLNVHLLRLHIHPWVGQNFFSSESQHKSWIQHLLDKVFELIAEIKLITHPSAVMSPEDVLSPDEGSVKRILNSSLHEWQLLSNHNK